MAEKKTKTVTQSTTKVDGKTVKPAKPVGNAKGLRAGAIVLWLFAFACEIIACLIYVGKIYMKFCPVTTQLIIFIVLDLAFVIAGSQLWKKANHIDPASKQNKVKFWLWNNMGVIVCAFAFIPFIILALTNKNADKKTKTIAIVAACVALIIGGLCSYDWNPVSVEEKDAAVGYFNAEKVYWAPFGRVYHTSTECQALANSETLTEGTVEQAIAENRTRLCSFCAKRDNIQGVATDGKSE